MTSSPLLHQNDNRKISFSDADQQHTVDMNQLTVTSTKSSRSSVGNILLKGDLYRKHRLVNKDGKVNIKHKYLGQPERYLADIFTTLVDIKWRWNLFIFSMAYTGSWFAFAGVWWLIALGHGDLVESNYKDPNFVPCAYNVNSWWSAFLFSLETQTTIGYGFRGMTEQCWPAFIVVIVQSVVACMIDAAMIGCMFAKIARPKKRAETLMFSKNAVITKRDGKLRLVMRIADVRKSLILNAQVQAKLIQRKTTEEGEVIPLHYDDVQVGFHQEVSHIFLVWPLEIEHIIDEHSPFYETAKEDLETSYFELIVILEGIVEQTGMTTQKRASYLPNEILWGHRFDQSIVQLGKSNYEIDYTKFNKTYEITTMPTKSARELDEGADEEDHTKYTKYNGTRFTMVPIPEDETLMKIESTL
ncbi:ATP-sensitive inward rectifier potassium channel 12-like isoform X1 [Glandiceps talaboti]